MEPLTADNVWIVSVRGAQRHYGAAAALAAAVGILFCALTFGPKLNQLWVSAYDGRSLSIAPLRIIAYLCVLVPLCMCFLLSPLWERRLSTPGAFGGWRGLIFGTILGASLFALTLMAASVLGIIRSQTFFPAEGRAFGVSLMAALTLFQVYGEEGFFRGWLQPILAADWGVWPAVSLTSVLFALAHVLTQSVSVLAAINILLAGLLFSLLALRTGDLFAPCAAHAMWNWLEQSIFGLFPNPGKDALGSIIDLDLVGPVFLAGGPDGLNGSIIVTFFFAATSCCLVAMPARQSRANNLS